MRFKGSRLTAFVLELDSVDIAEIKSRIANDVQRAPQLFLEAPLVLKISQPIYEEALVDELVELCKSVGLKPMAIECESSLPNEYIAGLPRLKAETLLGASKDHATQSKEAEANKVHRATTKIIDKPVRSGQQVYAKDGDLVVLGNVGAGAEVIADGCIHVYGALRGRAIAGATGDESARIFCQHLDAELLSIAGNYILRDAMDEGCLAKPTNISLKDKQFQLVNL